MREEEIDVYLFHVTGLPYPVGICVSFVGLILFILFSSFFVFVFFRAGKSLACNSPAKWCLCA